MKTETYKWIIVRNTNNAITQYLGINNGVHVTTVDRVDAIGVGIVYVHDGFVFTKLATVKKYAQAGA
jgi:hydrogenase maturation factor